MAYLITFNGNLYTSETEQEFHALNDFGFIVTVYGNDVVRTFCNVTEVHTGITGERGDCIAIESDIHSNGMCPRVKDFCGGIVVVMITEATALHPEYDGKSMSSKVNGKINRISQ
jgi:hypothetical protein